MSNEANPSNKKFAIVNIYTKDISFESPNSPQMFGVEWRPKVDFDIQMGSKPLGDNLFEAILHLTVTTTVAVPKADSKKNGEPNTEDKVAFIVEVKQAGVFSIEGFEEKENEQILATSAQEILFPYAREVVSNTVAKGSYPQMLLPPVNFDLLYHEHKNKIHQKSAANEPIKEKEGS